MGTAGVSPGVLLGWLGSRNMLLARGDRVAAGIYCTASSQRCRRNSRETRTGHRFTFASSLIFHTISSMQALASSLESCPSTLSWMMRLR